MNNTLHTQTAAVHGGTRKDDTFGAINEPIYMTSNYRIPTDGTPVDWSGIHSNIYQRNRNVNQMVLQEKLCALTGAEDGAVFASGVVITSSTAIFDATTGEFIRRNADGRIVVPRGAVVVSGSKPVSKGPAAGSGVHLYCPVIVKYRDEKTAGSVHLEDMLR